jgi:hypothetical protein
MSRPTYDVQVGDSFRAYGESILLDKIQFQDLPRYREPDREQYLRKFEAFKANKHLVPEFFEYLLVAPEKEELHCTTQPLSWASEPLILDEQLRKNTRWFVADISRTALFSISGQPYNDFCLRVTMKYAA